MQESQNSKMDHMTPTQPHQLQWGRGGGRNLSICQLVEYFPRYFPHQVRNAYHSSTLKYRGYIKNKVHLGANFGVLTVWVTWLIINYCCCCCLLLLLPATCYCYSYCCCYYYYYYYSYYYYYYYYFQFSSIWSMSMGIPQAKVGPN